MTSFKDQDAASYDRVAQSYAYFTDLTTTPLAKTMVRLAELTGGERILDVGTGTGIVALAVAEWMQPPAGVTGIDLSAGQLQVAREKVKEKERTSIIRLCRADAERLPFAPDRFDVVVSLFALLHFPDPGQALQEMFRVLRPQGRVVIGLGSPPPLTSAVGWLHRLRRAPDVARLALGRLRLAPAQLDRLVRNHIPPRGESEVTRLASHARRHPQATALVRSAGFVDIRSVWEGHRTTFDDPGQFWELQSTFSSLARKRLASASAGLVASVRREFMQECSSVLDRGGALEYHHAALFIVARKP